MITQQVVQDSILALLIERYGEAKGQRQFDTLPDTFFNTQLERLAILADDISEQRKVTPVDAEQEAIERWAQDIASMDWATTQAS